jgi:hypothetical protein
MWGSFEMATAAVVVWGIAMFWLGLRAEKAARGAAGTDSQRLARTLDRIEAELRTARELSRSTR